LNCSKNRKGIRDQKNSLVLKKKVSSWCQKNRLEEEHFEGQAKQ
jgi:hypothetical protein